MFVGSPNEVTVLPLARMNHALNAIAEVAQLFFRHGRGAAFFVIIDMRPALNCIVEVFWRRSGEMKRTEPGNDRSNGSDGAGSVSTDH